MKQLLGLVVTLVFVAASISSRENFQSSQEVRELRPIAAVDIKNSINGETPAGTKIKEGTWTVGAEAEILEAAAEPLVQSWLEFGPEIREKIATIKGVGKAEGRERIQPRFGVGLYGSNGFQIRLVPAWNRVEVVRRGDVVDSIGFELKAELRYEMEFACIEEEESWLLKVRVWEFDSERPEMPLMKLWYPKAKLRFPLAGRGVLTATPFSGKPVTFYSAEIYLEEFNPVNAAGETVDSKIDSVE